MVSEVGGARSAAGAARPARVESARVEAASLEAVRPLAWRAWAAAWLVWSALGAASCGDPSDRPQDCTRSEYFDEGEQLCIACPVVREPSCRPGCGFVIEADERGCPTARCDLECSLCPEGQRWSDALLSCQPTP